MKYFKYLIFFLSTSSFAGWVGPSSTVVFNTPQEAYANFAKVSTSSVKCAQLSQYQYSCNHGGGNTIVYYREGCRSATQATLSVLRNAGNYVCVQNCQYALQGCVDVQFGSGTNPDGGDRTKMTCSAISTGKNCTGTTNNNDGSTSNPTTTGNPGSNASNDGSQSSTNSAVSNSTTTNTSTSTSNTTTNTTNNTTNNTSTSNSTTTTNTTNTTNTTTNTIIDLSSLENTISNGTKLIVDAINKMSEKLGGQGTGNGVDLTKTNATLDKIDKNGKDLNGFLTGCKTQPSSSEPTPDSQQGSSSASSLTADCNSQGEVDGTVELETPENVEIPTKQYLNWSASCPLSQGSTSISLNGQSSSIDNNFTSWCDTAIQLRPFVLAAGAIIAFLIASGVWMGRGE